MTVRESDIEKYLVKRVKALGGEVRKVQWVGRRNAPDRLVMLPGVLVKPHKPADARVARFMQQYLNALMVRGTGASIWVELKAPGKKARIGQLREHDRMRAMGQRVVVIDSLEGVEELLS